MGKRDGCGATGHVEDETFLEADGATSSISFRLIRVAVLKTLTDSFYKLIAC